MWLITADRERWWLTQKVSAQHRSPLWHPAAPRTSPNNTTSHRPWCRNFTAVGSTLCRRIFLPDIVSNLWLYTLQRCGRTYDLRCSDSYFFITCCVISGLRLPTLFPYVSVLAGGFGWGFSVLTNTFSLNFTSDLRFLILKGQILLELNPRCEPETNECRSLGRQLREGSMDQALIRLG